MTQSWRAARRAQTVLNRDRLRDAGLRAAPVCRFRERKTRSSPQHWDAGRRRACRPYGLRSRLMRNVTTAPRPDLWRVASELTITPTGDDLGSRAARRLVRRRRRRNWWWFGGATVVAFAAGVLAVLLQHPVASSALTVLAALGVALAAAAGTVQLRAGTYRRLTSRMRRGATPAWWVFTSLAWAAVLSAGVAAIITVTSEGSFTSVESLVSTKLAAFMLGFVGMLLSAASSASVPPLLSASPKPRQYQAHWSQLTWTASLLAATLSAMSLALYRGQDSWVVEVTVTIGFAFIAALLAWHARALHNLRSQRARLLDGLAGAYELMTDADNTDAAVTRTLLALRALTVPDPFRSQSPAAPPAATGWEIAEVVSILLHAYGYGDLPESVASRALRALRTLGGGGGVEAAGDEEHAESVVVVVAEAAGDAAGEFDEAVHGLGAAVG
ncbi:hypothetical protein FHX68_1256 [Microbacterium lacticum]|uniref:Uncharacterized protein n=1 Tax=Microbacterium lacticum TaxID=33885 RepID=A0A543KU11_9MICO|nr:hypothetical protein FHX68_1256 [Microbacterium lacticum]